jgi:hypothetical protein
LVYNTTDFANFRPIDGAFITIERKILHKPIPKHQNKGNKKTFWQENGIYLGILFLTLLFAGGTWWRFEGRSKPKNYENTTETLQTPPTDTINEIVFDTVSWSKDSSVYKTNYSKVEKYRFKVENKNWTYKNTERKNPYTAFYKNNLDEIIAKDSLQMDGKAKTEFLEALGKIGGERILEKEVNEKTATEIKKPEEVIIKEAPKPIKNKAIPASKKAKPKNDLESGADLPG